MNKKAFTIIELIFVIVILGILAAVAIPRLVATRDDAVVAKSLSDMSVSLSDFGSYYTAHNGFGVVKDMTSVSFDNDAKDLKNGGEIFFVTQKANGVEECAKYVFTKDGNITISSKSGVSGNVCKIVQSTDMYKKLATTHHTGGNRVKF